MHSPRVSLLAAALLAIPIFNLISLWFGHVEPWINPEQIRASAYIWSPADESVGSRLQKMFNWAALDTANPTMWRELTPAHRVRPLSDAAQVIDAAARPTIAETLYPHPSLTPSAVLVVLAAPMLLFGFLRRVSGSTIFAAASIGIWMSSISFLSLVLIDNHAGAKRLAILFICLSLYLAERHHSSRRSSTFILFAAALFISLFADELSLGGYVAIAAIYIPSIWQQSRPKAAVVLTMPLLYVVCVKWGLPATYAMLSVEGTPPFNAFGDGRKLGLFTYFLDPQFYITGLSQTASAILTTLGILRHPPWAQATVIGAIIVAGCYAASMTRQRRIDPRCSLAAGALLANGLYLSMIDQYSPGSDYIATYAYYYHSSLPVLALVFAGFFFAATHKVRGRLFHYPAATVTVAAGCVAVMIINPSNFHKINQMISLAQYYPFRPATLVAQVRSNAERLREATGPVPLQFTHDCKASIVEFNTIFANLFGDRAWGKNEFHRAYLMFWLGEADLRHLVTIFFPDTQVEIEVTSDPSCEKARWITRVAADRTVARPGDQITVAGSGVTSASGYYIRWNGPDGPALFSGMADRWGNTVPATVTIPNVAPGTYTLLLTNQRDSNATTNITVAPR